MTGVDPIRILEEIADRPEWDSRFRDNQIRSLAARERANWDRRRAEGARKLKARATGS